MNIRKPGFTCLLLVLCSHPVYAYRGNKGPKASLTKVAKTKQKKAVSTTSSFSITAFLKEKLFSVSSERLRPSRSERMQYLAHKKGSSQHDDSILLAEKENVRPQRKI